MSIENKCKVYEGNAVRQVTGESIRPGGFRLTERALEICSLPKGAKILDLGCGTGATVEYLINKNKFSVVGVDPSDILLNKGLQRVQNLPILKAVGEALPFTNEEIDCIFAECALSVMDNLDLALAECYRILKNRGFLVVSDIYVRTPATGAELNKLPLASCITGALSRCQLEGKLKIAGFGVTFWEDHSDLLKELVIKLIMSHGSMNDFWLQAGSEDCDVSLIQETIKKTRPGYFLLVAQKG